MPQSPLDILSLEDFKYQLGEPQDDTVNDKKLESYIEGAVALVSDAYGASLVDRKRWINVGRAWEIDAVTFALFGEVLKGISSVRDVPSEEGDNASETEVDIKVELSKIKKGNNDGWIFYAIYPSTIGLDRWPDGFLSLLVNAGVDTSEENDGSGIPETLKRAVILAAKDLWNEKEKLSPIVHQMIASLTDTDEY